MPTRPTAGEWLDRTFNDMRHRVLSLAADFDRIDRADGAAVTGSDPRIARLREAIGVLLDGGTDRAERVQMVFSLPYDADWRKQVSSAP
jgi:hypothetical protein